MPHIEYEKWGLPFGRLSMTVEFLIGALGMIRVRQRSMKLFSSLNLSRTESQNCKFWLSVLEMFDMSGVDTRCCRDTRGIGSIPVVYRPPD
jgi:hypothetical protein